MVANKKMIFLILSGIFIASLGIFNPAYLVLGLQILFLAGLKDKEKTKLLIAAGMAVCLTFFVYSGYLNFIFMPQAKELLNYNTNLLYWLQQGHVHAVRLFIAYPGYIISTWYQISLDKGYSYYLILIFFLTFITVFNLSMIKNAHSVFSTAALALFVLGLCFIMNGRIIFAFLGYALVITAALEQARHKCFIRLWEGILYGIGILFTTVSSGCMIIGFLFTAFCFFIKWAYIRSAVRKLYVVMGLIGSAVVFFPVVKKVIAYIAFMINKNITFYGGGIEGVIGMLQHGLGRIFPQFTTNMYLFLLIAGFFAVIVNAVLLKRFFIQNFNFTAIIALALNLSCYGILVGFSTGSMGLIPFFAWLCKKFNCLKIAGK